MGRDVDDEETFAVEDTVGLSQSRIWIVEMLDHVEERGDAEGAVWERKPFAGGRGRQQGMTGARLTAKPFGPVDAHEPLGVPTEDGGDTTCTCTDVEEACRTSPVEMAAQGIGDERALATEPPVISVGVD